MKGEFFYSGGSFIEKGQTGMIMQAPGSILIIKTDCRY